MRQTLLFILLISLLLPACASQTPTPSVAQQPTLTLTDCVLPVPSGQQVSAKCATLNVPEDRANSHGRQIALNIAVIPAIKRKPAPDPLFLLAGGPGQSAVDAYPVLLQTLYTIHQSRDLVLVDQRGTGKSNPLRCIDPLADEALTEAQVNERMAACPARLDADLRFYTTEIAMQDLDDVRAALGYERINLYGASYGTRAALTYLRMFPARVRTITLDAVVDPQFVMYMDAASDGQKSLEYFFARCAADAACGATFPALRSEFAGLLKHLDAAPELLTLPHPLTHKPLQLTLTRHMLTNLVFSTLYSPDLVATLPLVIHAAAQGDFVPLVSQAYLLDAGIYDGMFYAVTCSEDAPQISAPAAAQRSTGSVFGDRTLDFTHICQTWPRGQVSQQFRAPLTSDVPALILSGEADPITPPWHAAQVAASFSKALHLVFKGMGHGNLSSHCATRLFSDFLDTANSQGLDTACVTGVQPPPFFVDFSGPRP